MLLRVEVVVVETIVLLFELVLVLVLFVVDTAVLLLELVLEVFVLVVVGSPATIL